MSRNLKLKKTTTKRTSYGIDGSAAKKAANKAASIAKNHIKKRGRVGKSIVKTIFRGYKALWLPQLKEKHIKVNGGVRATSG